MGGLEKCEVVAQDSIKTVNSGFVMLRNRSGVRRLVEQWLRQTANCTFNGDQGSFQIQVLRAAFASRGKKYPTDGLCCADDLNANESNLCWAAEMEKLDYRLNERTHVGGTVCLLPTTVGTRWNIHDMADAQG